MAKMVRTRSASALRDKVFCAFCRVERRIYIKKHLSVPDVLICLVLSGLVMIILWQDFDPRSGLIFALFLTVAEMFTRLRWRLSLACRVCGFDPILYKRDVHKAVARVKDHLKRRSEDPAAILGPQPNIPVAVKRGGVVVKYKRLDMGADAPEL